MFVLPPSAAADPERNARLPGIPSGTEFLRPPDGHRAPAAAGREARSPAALPEVADPAARERRLSWADLIRRVFAVDVLRCVRCGGRMRIVAAVHSPDAIRAILDCLKLPSRAPPHVPARADDAEPRLPGFDHPSDGPDR